jgi:asparagine synthase (glutamine-hydrolysing)
VRASRPGSRPALFHPALLERVGAEAIARAWPQRFPGQLDQTLYAQVIGQSLPALLQYEDGNSMAFSIEARVPLLDHRIVEFAFALEGTHKVHGSWTKWILRKAAEPYLPGAVAWRRSKLGYPTPFSRWLRTEPMRGLLEDMLFSAQTRAREIVNAQAVRLLWDAHQERRADNGWLIWRLVTLELWHRGLKHFATARVPSAPRV